MAVEFVYDGNALFLDTPIVFLTNQRRTLRRPNATGVIHERNYLPTVALLRQLQPNVRNVFIVTGAAAADEEYEDEIRRQLQSSDSRLNFT